MNDGAAVFQFLVQTDCDALPQAIEGRLDISVEELHLRGIEPGLAELFAEAARIHGAGVTKERPFIVFAKEEARESGGPGVFPEMSVVLEGSGELRIGCRGSILGGLGEPYPEREVATVRRDVILCGY